MLNFIGTGSAFNTKLGNNGAFVKSPSGKVMFMIDCGELTFDRLTRYGVLDGVEEVHVLITHFHPDHIGSLGSLAAHLYYLEEPFRSRLTIYTPNTQDLHLLLKLTGVRPIFYNSRTLEGDGRRNLIDMGGDMGRIVISPLRVPHMHLMQSLICYGYILEFIDMMKGTRIYYSGDSSAMPERVITELQSGELHMVYQDTSTHDYEDNVHLSLKKLDGMTPNIREIREKIWCMHLDRFWDPKTAYNMGFNTVRPIPRIMNEILKEFANKVEPLDREDILVYPELGQNLNKSN